MIPLLLSFFHRTDAQIRIVAPLDAVDLFGANNGIIDGSTATFGAPYYGEKVVHHRHHLKMRR